MTNKSVINHTSFLMVFSNEAQLGSIGRGRARERQYYQQQFLGSNNPLSEKEWMRLQDNDFLNFIISSSNRRKGVVQLHIRVCRLSYTYVLHLLMQDFLHIGLKTMIDFPHKRDSTVQGKGEKIKIGNITIEVKFKILNKEKGTRRYYNNESRWRKFVISR